MVQSLFEAKSARLLETSSLRKKVENFFSTCFRKRASRPKYIGPSRRLPEAVTEKSFSTFLRNRARLQQSRRLPPQKGTGTSLDAVRQRFQTITARFAGFQAQWLNVPRSDFPLLQRLALPIIHRRGPPSRHQDPRPRLIRLP